MSTLYGAENPALSGLFWFCCGAVIAGVLAPAIWAHVCRRLLDQRNFHQGIAAQAVAANHKLASDLRAAQSVRVLEHCEPADLGPDDPSEPEL